MDTCSIRCAPAYYITGTREESTDGLLRCDADGVVHGDLKCARKTCTVHNIKEYFDDPHAVAGSCNTINGDENTLKMFANTYCKLGCATGYHGSDSAYGVLHCKGDTGPFNSSGLLAGGMQCELKSCVVGDIEQQFGPNVLAGTCGSTALGTQQRRIPIEPSDAVVCDFHSESDEADNTSSSAASFDYFEMDEAGDCKCRKYKHPFLWK